MLKIGCKKWLHQPLLMKISQQNSTKHSNRMHTTYMPIVHVLVPVTRCQYCREVYHGTWDKTQQNTSTYTSPGHTHHQTCPPLDMLTSWRYSHTAWNIHPLAENTHPSLVTPGGHHWRHTHANPLLHRMIGACENITLPQLLLKVVTRQTKDIMHPHNTRKWPRMNLGVDLFKQNK